MKAKLFWAIVLLHSMIFSASAADHKLPSRAEAIAALTDLWGEAAMRLPNGPSYEFFEPLLPPPRYVHADFRYYPLVLSDAQSATKARLISNGSGVNLRGGSRSWKDIGTPVLFRVGSDEFQFGGLADRLSHPQLAEGWLPIYTIDYRHPTPVQAEGLVPIDHKPAQLPAEVYRLEAFCSTDPKLAANAVVFMRFTLAAGAKGIITAHLDPPGEATFAQQSICDRSGKTIVYLDQNWKWDRQAVHATLLPNTSATLAIVTKSLDTPLNFDEKTYDQQRAITIQKWKSLIDKGMYVEVPEPRVNHAWRNLLVQNQMLMRGPRMHYSAGNQYDALYCAEGSDAAMAMMMWGMEQDAAAMIGPIMAFTRKGLENHQAGLKLQDVIRYWWQTRDTDWVKRTRPQWQVELNRLLNSRTSPEGLYPKERYCGDISTHVYSLSVQAKAWRALHDFPPVLEAIDDTTTANQVRTAAKEFHAKLLPVVMKSVRRESNPPFIPIALQDKEQIHSPITSTRIGSYWNIINGYVIGSRLFAPGTAEDEWLPKFVETHGGIFLGMTRSGGTAHAFWTGPERVNPLYGTRYVVDTLRRDDPERALVSFYGMLAQGFTRNTFIGGEGCTIEPVDAGGRFFYCPPNSASNAHFLTMLRTMLVQDFDLDNDGIPDSLRLGYGMSRRWIEDGKQIVVRNAPTPFGPVSVTWQSQLKQERIIAIVEVPDRNPIPKLLLRVRVPDGWKASSATVKGKHLTVDVSGSVDLTGHTGKVEIQFSVHKI